MGSNARYQVNPRTGGPLRYRLVRAEPPTLLSDLTTPLPDEIPVIPPDYPGDEE